VIGTVEQCAQRVQELADVGVHEFNIYLMTDDKERMLASYGREIVPRFAAARHG
jgi:hypothetical protein